jgi:hypothetical protein
MDPRRAIRKGSVPRSGTISLLLRRSYAILHMKLMGISRLQRVCDRNVGEVAGAISALRAELEAADWRCPEAAERTYPNAWRSGHRLRICIGEGHCVLLAANYEARVILIEYAGPDGECPKVTDGEGSKAG